MSEEQNESLEGQINLNVELGQAEHGQSVSHKDFQDMSTLDEPVSATIMRDLRKICTKLKYVLLVSRQENANQLRDWDLWGPLFLCLILGATLSVTRDNKESDSALIFTMVFVLIWIGSFVVTVNAVMLGASLSFFQSVCVLGYCVFPLDIAALITGSFDKWLPSIAKLLIAICGMVWATLSSKGFMGQLVKSSREMLAVYPVMLFYLFLAWFILIVWLNF